MQGSRLYVGNLTYSVTSENLRELFASYGDVRDVTVIEGKGFGFVEMSSPADAARAREELNGTEYKGRVMRVDEARPPQQNRTRREGGRRG